ncbi:MULTISPECIES: DUF4381 domain-containing protein [Roseobacteraceae]|uniref:DUF4381 domain-containing protein n=1 Tax=Falsiruegeria litorea TaxID=1280831 RepID=A0ABS5WMN1_9RHOB|nr:DUF4381 domain-containing protein [Falsiruegeria litorea]MBT3140388.1 DUF4381 domain-containing protein [Falsiruegeria litorea]MBT8171173.1 DUF4381 domain-containing protein [Falsiruegeria litorea]
MTEEYSGKSLTELLDMLVPITEPPAISMMPQTIGWAFLGGAIALLGAWAARRVIKHRAANAYRKIALQNLEHLQDDPAQIAVLLRRTALAAYPRSRVAGLYGNEWLTFLDRTSGNCGFLSETGQNLISAPYRAPKPNKDVTKLARFWINKHQSEVPQ